MIARGVSSGSGSISVFSDTATVDDPHEVTDAMVAAFKEIRAAAGLDPISQ